MGDKGLTLKQRQRVLAVNLRLRGLSLRAIAQEVGVSTNTVYRWTKDVNTNTRGAK